MLINKSMKNRQQGFIPPCGFVPYSLGLNSYEYPGQQGLQGSLLRWLHTSVCPADCLAGHPAKKLSNSRRVSVEVCISFTISPLFKTTMRSHTSVICIRSWLDINTVIPCLAAKSLMIAFNLICVVGSKLAKGSSKMITSGFPINEATIPAFFWFPLERSRKYFVGPISPHGKNLQNWKVTR